MTRRVSVDPVGNIVYTDDMFGRRAYGGVTEKDVSTMGSPVVCECGGIYDLEAVTVTARYADCSVWRTPCCKRECDDRPPGWKSGPTYERIEKP